ncbi:MAG: c-type cytochrome [Pseudomonadota bacterium]
MRIIAIIAVLAAGLVAVAFAAVYAVSEARLRDVVLGSDFDHPIPADAASVERGRHLARTRGCFGCHGQKLEGKDFDEQWDWPARAVAPNLASYAQANSPQAIEAAVRQGVGRDGKALVSMPSFNFARLTDEDMAALIAFLQSAPVVEQELPTPRLGWFVRWDFARGAEKHMGYWVKLVPELRVDPVAEPQRSRGEYLAMTMCNECHGLDVRGDTLYGQTPDLSMVAAYSREDFETLIKTGVASGDRQLGLMSLVAPDRFPELSDREIDDLYVFLSSLPNEPVPENVPWRPAN